MIYYVSNLGSDLSDGLTPETAWATIAKVNASIKAGDEVRFRSGDTFYGRVFPPRGDDPASPTTYTSWGEGKKPTISQYKTIKPAAWEKADDKVWRVDMKNTDNFTGNVDQLDANVGFMLISGTVRAYKRFKLEDLAGLWDFFNDDQYVYVKTDGRRPDELSDDIRFACNIGCVGFTDCLKITNIIFNGTGGHGVSGVVHHAYIGNCEFHNLGGSRLPGYPNPTTRYGNGVECWSNSCDVVVENCRFSGIFDVAITMQGNNVVTSWTDMYFRGNVMWNCQQCFEIWSRGDKPDTGFVNCHFENNVCLDSGYCWGYEVRPNKGVSSPLLIYGLECPLCDITVTGNTFSNARVCTVFKSGGVKDIPADYKIFGNTILRPAGQPIGWCGDTPDDQVAAFEAKIAADNLVMDVVKYE